MKATFSEQLLFRRTIIFKIKISTEKLVFRSRYFCTASTFSEQLVFQQSYFFKRGTFSEKKVNFSEKQYTEVLHFSGELLYQSDYFFKTPTFLNSYLFRRATFWQYNFSDEVLFRKQKCGSSFFCIYYCSKSHHRYNLFD